MSPYEIGILIWYYAHVDDHPDIERRPPVWEPTLDQFLRWNLLRPSFETERHYMLSDRGRAYVEALQRVPLPTSIWVVEGLPGSTPRREDPLLIPSER